MTSLYSIHIVTTDTGEVQQKSSLMSTEEVKEVFKIIDFMTVNTGLSVKIWDFNLKQYIKQSEL